MTGAWGFYAKGFEPVLQISYPLRLASAPSTVETVDKDFPTANCGGIGEAAPGVLCIYTNGPTITGGTIPTDPVYTQDPKSGFTTFVSVEPGATGTYGFGSWAVTATE